MPGEVSLAPNGVLFFDELPEFQRSALEALRQPMENKNVTIARVNGTHTYPANFSCIRLVLLPCVFYAYCRYESVSVRLFSGEKVPLFRL